MHPGATTQNPTTDLTSLPPAVLVDEADARDARYAATVDRVTELEAELATAQAAAEIAYDELEEAMAEVSTRADAAFPDLPKRERPAAYRGVVAEAEEAFGDGADTDTAISTILVEDAVSGIDGEPEMYPLALTGGEAATLASASSTSAAFRLAARGRALLEEGQALIRQAVTAAADARCVEDGPGERRASAFVAHAIEEDLSSGRIERAFAPVVAALADLLPGDRADAIQAAREVTGAEVWDGEVDVHREARA